MISRIWSSHVENREVRFQTHQFGVAAQDLHPDRVEGAKPRHSLDNLPHHLADAQLHLARGLVGEGHRQDLRRMRPAEPQDMRDPRCSRHGFSRFRARQDQHRAVQRLDREALLRIQRGHVIGRRPALHRLHCARGNTHFSGLFACSAMQNLKANMAPDGPKREGSASRLWKTDPQVAS